MPADEVTHGADVEASRARTGPRHAAPKKPLFTRFHMPAGKAIAIAAMPTAVLMGMGFTPTLAQADDQPSSRNLTADEFKECLEAIEKAEEGDASASPTPSATASESASEDAEEPSADPTGSAPAQEAPDADEDADKGSDSSPDSGSDDEAEPTPTPSATAGGQAADTEPAPSPSETDKNLLEQIGDAIEDVFTPGEKAEETPSPSPSASASSSAPAEETDENAEEAPQKPAEKAAGDVLEQTGDAVQDATEQAEEAVEEETQEPEATASPSPSESSGIDLEDCPVATDAEGGVDNNVPLPDDPWFLNASSLLLKGADYKGIVEVRTANGTKKKVLKYVISDGTDIGDLHQTVKDPQTGKTYHVQAAKGSTSTIRDGDTVMYTESISGNLLGLIPVTFDPENPPPLNIPLIYFTKVTVQQAGQFGGTLHVPGLHQYVTD
ncbi:prolipoprotein diacylglyceryl transferase [Streptomyces albogriseolus]|uniref:hypothetical protein n=1 Tax=Streptomyces albogriseolus TaxID=1887 RepID=UPI00224FEC0A|nr:hypothetical protein [Streptomyces viridodiastaticus]MCX4622464.1 hypothetical protein [Streptomyces viridodiastaticus]